MSATATATRSGATAVQPGGRRPRHRGVMVLTLAAGVLVLGLLAGWLVLLSPVLAAKRVAVDGTRALGVAQVEDAAQVPMGRPLSRIDVQAIAERTAALPRVESAEVTRDWPRTVHIAVVERRPLLAVAQPGGYVMVDRTGRAFETVDAVPAGVLNARVNPDNGPLLAEVGVVAGALSEQLRDDVRRVSAPSADNIMLTLDSGVLVNWGSSADSALKAELTAVLLKQDPRTSIDVSSPHNPAVR